MLRRFALVLPVCLGLVIAGSGQEKPKAPASPPAKSAATSPSADKLVEQLGDRDFQVRETAAKALEALGPAALDALKKATNHSDPEVRRRVNALIPGIERAAALAPKRMNLVFKDKKMKDI